MSDDLNAAGSLFQIDFDLSRLTQIDSFESQGSSVLPAL